MLKLLHRMRDAATYPTEATQRAPDVLATWLHYAPTSTAVARDWEDWAENAVMLHAMHQHGPVELLGTTKGYTMSGDLTPSIASDPEGKGAFLYGVFNGHDNIDFPAGHQLRGNSSDCVKRVTNYATSPTFLAAAARGFVIVDMEMDAIEAALQTFYDAGIRSIFVKTRWKDIATPITLGDDRTRLWRNCTDQCESLEWLPVSHEGVKNALYIQEAFEPTYEYRMIIAGDRIATGAGCIEAFTPLDNVGDMLDPRFERVRNSQETVTDIQRVFGYQRFASEFAKRWAVEQGSDMIYSLDIATDARTGRFVAIELNPFTNLGLYACNAGRLVATALETFRS